HPLEKAQSESGRNIPWYVHDSHTGRAVSMSPNDTALRRSGNVHATSYIGRARASDTISIRRKVQRRSGACAAWGIAGAAKGRGMTAMGGTLCVRCRAVRQPAVLADFDLVATNPALVI